MKKGLIVSLIVGINTLLLSVLVTWLAFFIRGKQFALREPLRKSDAIVVLAGTRGNIHFLNGKIRTAVHLYHEGWAPFIICTGKFSVKVTESPTLIPVEELQQAVVAGRIQDKDVKNAEKTWDIGLGAAYMRDQTIQMHVPATAIFVEQASLHTRENAEYVLQLLQNQNMHRIILVTSPFHQLRTFLTFAKVLQPQGIEIINYYAETGEWHPALWFISAKNRKLVHSEIERIRLYRKKGDLL